MELTKIKTETYRDGDWMLDFVIFPEGNTETWLYRSNIGIKELSFGLNNDVSLVKARETALASFLEDPYNERNEYDEKHNLQNE